MAKKRLKFDFFKKRTYLINFFIHQYWYIILFLVILFLRLPSVFEPFTYGDEGIYLTLGQAIRQGLVLYRDIHDNKPPLLYLLATFAGNFSFYRALLLLWSFATVFLFSRLILILFKKGLCQIFLTFLFAVLISIRTFEGNVGNAENFMLLPTLGGFYLYLKAKRQREYFFSGLLFSLAFLFKVPAFFDFAALLVFIFIVNFFKKKNYPLLLVRFFLLIVGFLLPILITVVYYKFFNAFDQYLKAAFFQNIPYLASWSLDKPKFAGFPVSLLGRAILVLVFFIFIFLFRQKFSLAMILILIWFPLSLFAALLSSRPYPHYLLQVIPPLTLSFGFLWKKTKEKIITFILFFSFLFSFFYFRFWHYQNISYYRNFYQYVLGKKNKIEYFKYFGENTEALYQISKYIKIHTLPKEKIFIWSNYPSIYALAHRLPIGRYTTAYHIFDFRGEQETMVALNKNPPRYLVVSTEEKRPFPDLFSFIQEKYLIVFKMGDFTILKLKK